MKVITYLNFPGNCQAALRFYEQALGARVQYLVPFKGSPVESQVPAEMADKVLHAVFDIGGTTFMASDRVGDPAGKMDGFAISLTLATPVEAERLFAALGVGGQVGMPMQETFWAQRFGMVTDQFGLPWMINCEKTM